MFVVLIIFIFFPKLVSAQSYSLYLSEIGIEPTQQVEIINTQNTEVDISGYYIDDDSGTTFFTIPPNSKIPPNNCIVFSGNFNLNKTTPDTLRFFTNKQPPTNTNAELVDSYTYSKSPGENLSFQRDISIDNKWEINSSTFGLLNKTKEPCLKNIISPTVTTAPTLIPTITPTPSPTLNLTPTPTLKLFRNFKKDLEANKILISEVYANPNNLENEWIEVFNSHPYEIYFSSWFLDDLEDSGGSPKQISGMIRPNEYAVFHLSTGIFNNESDDVRLLDQDMKVIDTMSYQRTIKGVSYGRNLNNNSWCFQLSTPYNHNANCLDTSTPFPAVTLSPSIKNPDYKNQITTKEEIPITLKLIPTVKKSNIYFSSSTSTNSQTLKEEVERPPEEIIKNSVKKNAWQSLSYFTYLTVSIVAIAVKIKNGF